MPWTLNGELLASIGGSNLVFDAFCPISSHSPYWHHGTPCSQKQNVWWVFNRIFTCPAPLMREHCYFYPLEMLTFLLLSTNKSNLDLPQSLTRLHTIQRSFLLMICFDVMALYEAENTRFREFSIVSLLYLRLRRKKIVPIPPFRCSLLFFVSTSKSIANSFPYLTGLQSVRGSLFLWLCFDVTTLHVAENNRHCEFSIVPWLYLHLFKK